MERAREAATRGDCRRETPLSRREEDGTLVEGVADLAFSGDTGNPFATLSITLAGNPGTINLERWGGEGRIEEFVFADGTHLTADQVNALAAGEAVALDQKPPVVNQPLLDRAIKVDTPFAFTLPADLFSDPNAGDTLTLTATLPEQQWVPQQPLPAWLAFDPLTRTFTGTPGSADAGSLTVEVRATDATGFSVKDRFTLTVGDSSDQNLINGSAGDDTLAGGVHLGRVIHRGYPHVKGSNGSRGLRFEKWSPKMASITTSAPALGSASSSVALR